MQYKDLTPLDVGEKIKSSLIRRSSKKVFYVSLVFILLIITLALVVYFIMKTDDQLGTNTSTNVTTDNITIIKKVTIITVRDNETQRAMLLNKQDIVGLVNTLQRSRWQPTREMNPTTGARDEGAHGTGEEIEKDGNNSAIALQLVQYVEGENHTSESAEWFLFPDNITEITASELDIATNEIADVNRTAAGDIYPASQDEVDATLLPSQLDINATGVESTSEDEVIVTGQPTENMTGETFVDAVSTIEDVGTVTGQPTENMIGDKIVEASSTSEDEVTVTDRLTTKVIGENISEANHKSVNEATTSYEPKVEDSLLSTISTSEAQQQYNSTDSNGEVSQPDNTSTASTISNVFTDARNKISSFLELMGSIFYLLSP